MTKIVKEARAQLLLSQSDSFARDAAVSFICEMAAPGAIIPSDPTEDAWSFFYRLELPKSSAKSFASEWRKSAALVMA